MAWWRNLDSVKNGEGGFLNLVTSISIVVHGSIGSLKMYVYNIIKKMYNLYLYIY